MSKILILGDVHLGKSPNLGKVNLNSVYNSRLIDQRKILDWVLEKAEEEVVSDIVITGDIFEDTNPKYEIINVFMEWLKKTNILNIKVHIILGNHDYTRINNIYYSPLDLINNTELDNVTVYKTPNTINVCDTYISMFPFCDRKSLFSESLSEAKNLIKKYIEYEYSLIPRAKNSIAIGHFALEGSLYIGDEIDDLTNEIIVPLDYFEYDYVWMGHVHKFQKLKENVYHIGSMDISDFGEANESKYIIIFDCKNNSFDEIKIPTVKLNKISLEISNENIDSIEELISNVSNQIVSLEIKYKQDVSPIGKSKLKSILQKNNPYIIANISETKEVKVTENKKTKKFKQNMTVVNAIESYAKEFVEEKYYEKFIAYSKDLFKTVGDK